MRIWLFVTLGLAVLSLMGWISDKITLQGERTVYTVECQQGSWQDQRCSGRLVAADRVRFRALKAHSEVLFWTSGASEPSGKFTNCKIQDGRNWNCKPNVDGPSTITHEMVHGRPIADPGNARPFHAVSKWRWWLLRWGVPLGNEAGA
jgi:hypothetical protein